MKRMAWRGEGGCSWKNELVWKTLEKLSTKLTMVIMMILMICVKIVL